MRDFREEYKAFLREYPYKTIEVDGVTIRYQRGGKEGATAASMRRCLQKNIRKW